MARVLPCSSSINEEVLIEINQIGNQFEVILPEQIMSQTQASESDVSMKIALGHNVERDLNAAINIAFEFLTIKQDLAKGLPKLNEFRLRSTSKSLGSEDKFRKCY